MFGYEAHGELHEHIPENGHAAAAVALCAAIIEAHVRRARLQQEGAKRADADQVHEGLRALLATPADVDTPASLVEAVEELFVVRNAVLHGHVWKIERGRWQTDRALQRPVRVVADRLVGRGALRTTEVDRMPTTGLNRIPTWVDVGDVIVALSLAVEVLDQLEQRGFSTFPVIVPLGGNPKGLAAAAVAFEAAVRARDAGNTH
jgi:hypothetical protein